jgi:hypothetical protein
MNAEKATVLDGFSDPDYPGPVYKAQKSNAKFGCGQQSHRIAVTLQGYKCDKYEIQDGSNQGKKTLTCANGWCEGELKFEECTNGCPEMEYKFYCNKDKVTKVSVLPEELKRSQVGMGSDDPEAAKNAKWGFACITTSVCKQEGMSEEQAKDAVACAERPATGDGNVKKRVKLVALQSLYDKTYLEKQSEGIQAYVVECISTNGTYRCTTGNPTHDQTIFGEPHVPAGYKMEMFKGSTGTKLENPVVYSQLDEDIDVVTSSTNNISSIFMMVYPQTDANAVVVGSASGQQQGTLSNSNGCYLVQDPYGRVFDAHTLEPLPGSEVTLLMPDTKGGYRSVEQKDVSDSPDVGRIDNPQTTSEDGMFSFWVPDGTYRLAVRKDGYDPLPKSTPDKWTSMMYANLYDGGDIVQKGAPVHRDVAMAPRDKVASEAFAQSNPITFVNYFQSIDKERGLYVIQGRVSHPRASVSVYARIPDPDGGSATITGRSLGRTDADMFGVFKLEIPLGKLRKNETVGQLEAVKKQVPFYTPQSYANPAKNAFARLAEALAALIAVDAADRETGRVSVSLDPVLEQVEGYAYDYDGSVMPGAMVGIYLPFTEDAVVETRADERGYFSFPRGSVPNMQYEIRYTPVSGEAVTMPTSDFVALNAQSRSTYYAKAGSQDTAVLGAFDQASGGRLPAWAALFLGGMILMAVLVTVTVFLSNGRLKQSRR